MIPKVGSRAEVDIVAAALDAAGGTDTAIWAMIETPTAIFDVRSIAAHPRVAVLVMGTNDLAREIGAPQVPGRSNLTPYLATAVLAAREAGKVILDGVYNDVRDDEGFAAECQQGVADGLRRQDADPPRPGRPGATRRGRRRATRSSTRAA